MQLSYVSRALREAKKALIPVVAVAALSVSIACGDGGPRSYNLNEVSRSTEAEINQLIGQGMLLPSEYRGSLLYPVDDRLGNIISGHVKNIIDKGYAKELSPEDFFYGSFLVADPSVCGTKEPSGGAARLANFAGTGIEEGKMKLPEDDWIDVFLNPEAGPHFIYYTRFHIGEIREREFQIGLNNPYRDPPRIIIGTSDGNVYPARSEATRFFFTGYLNPFEPFEFNGQKYNGMCDPIGSYTFFPNRVTLNIDGKIFRLRSNSFYIIKDEKGRYKLLDGTRFEVFYWLFGELERRE